MYLNGIIGAAERALDLHKVVICLLIVSVCFYVFV